MRKDISEDLTLTTVLQLIQECDAELIAIKALHERGAATPNDTHNRREEVIHELTDLHSLRRKLQLSPAP